MIYLQGITKTSRSRHDAPSLVFGPTSIGFPTNRRVAILGGRLAGKTLLLRLMAGEEVPDTGEVHTSVRVSPVANSKPLCHARLSVVENIRFAARMYGVDPEYMVAAVSESANLGDVLDRPLTLLNSGQRQKLELALLSALVFDCYLFDHIHNVQPDLLKAYFDKMTDRGAGLIFAAHASRQARVLADCAAVIWGRTIHPFDSVDEAIEFYEGTLR